MLEDYDEALDYETNSAKPRYRHLYCGSTNAYRDLLKFYRKRMTCSCLKKMHLEARKAYPKVGACDHCRVVQDRSLLMVCSRCMVAPYCSRECQVAASPGHRTDCDIFVRAHNNTGELQLPTGESYCLSTFIAKQELDKSEVYQIGYGIAEDINQTECCTISNHLHQTPCSNRMHI